MGLIKKDPLGFIGWVGNHANPATTPFYRQRWKQQSKQFKKGKAAGVDNIPAELVKAGGETMISPIEHMQ